MTFYPSEHEKVDWSEIGDAAPRTEADALPRTEADAEECDRKCNDDDGELFGECPNPCQKDSGEDEPEQPEKSDARPPYMSLAEMALEIRESMNALPDRQFPVETINAASILLAAQMIHEAIYEVIERLGVLGLALRLPSGEEQEEKE